MRLAATHVVRALVVSPHFDDAVLSLGQWLTLHPGTVVATVCSHMPHTDNPLVTDYDTKCGFRDAQHAVLSRRVEDRAALRVMQADRVELGFTDGAYQPARSVNFVEQVESAIRKAAHRFGPFDVVLGPVGLMHPDHRATAAATARLAQSSSVAVKFYEELPYRVMFPETVPAALRLIERELGPLVLAGPHHASLRRKRAAIRAYESQLWALNRRCCYVPERIWEREL